MQRRRRASLRKLALATVLACAITGCYKFVPLDAEPDPGRELRVSLTDAGSLRLAPFIGTRIEALDGRAMQVTDSSLVLAMLATISRSGQSVSWSRERFEVPRSAIAELRRRELDRTKTWIASGIGVAAVVLIGKAFGLGSGFEGFLGRGGRVDQQ